MKKRKRKLGPSTRKKPKEWILEMKKKRKPPENSVRKAKSSSGMINDYLEEESRTTHEIKNCQKKMKNKRTYR